MADGLLRKKVADEGLNIIVDSAGTSGHHTGEAPDARMRSTARFLGTPIDELRARKFIAKDFQDFDLIYVMDKGNYRDVIALSSTEQERQKVRLILDELELDKGLEVPDPYYGGEQGFIDVYRMLDQATDKIIQKLRND
jgi:protein-tyrosine phosphatase